MAALGIYVTNQENWFYINTHWNCREVMWYIAVLIGRPNAFQLLVSSLKKIQAVTIKKEAWSIEYD